MAIALIRTSLLKLQLRYPGQLPDRAIEGCDIAAIYKTTIPKIKAWVAASRGVDFIGTTILQETVFTEHPLNSQQDPDSSHSWADSNG